MENNILEKVKYNHHGLVPAIAQDVESGRVLMMAWMNEESLKPVSYTHLDPAR